ncbi:nitrate reductase molybdenum cofactor assembly chaperone [Streptomyces bomunensis]|uniref:Nitrate reductase molybdenum cofactor assembly chaperone n=1 Tax=Streptomyces montanisoli TaxID=2798581 RepID=A0A940RW91_9ACTN|nr:nitrate reductase molybdenum cofactor assembly chaperone [Streptomyces montanisoli]
MVHRAAAHCLTYPDDEQAAGLPLLRAALDEAGGGPAASLLRRYVEHAATTATAALAAHYVEVFDFKNRHSLHLTWWQDGDTRRRGASLVRLKDVYRAHGLDLLDGELPDFLPAVLEFCARTGSSELLREHRPGLELLRIALSDAGTPYADVLAAVCATLPGPSPKDRAAARALARSGPPREDVGLEPYGKPHGQPHGHRALLPLLTANGPRQEER